MNCTEMRSELSAYIDGELSATARTEVEAHLQACQECRGELDSFQAMDLDFQEHLPRLDPDPSLFVRFQSMLDRAVPRRLSWWKLGWITAATAAATLMVLLGVGEIRERRQTEALLHQIDAYQQRVPVRNVFALGRYNEGRNPFDYHARLAQRHPFKVADSQPVVNSVPQGGER
ncbi:MAG: zf-HC2 domain-containing protein [Acidobacteriota bacterium]